MKRLMVSPQDSSCTTSQLLPPREGRSTRRMIEKKVCEEKRCQFSLLTFFSQIFHILVTHAPLGYESQDRCNSPQVTNQMPVAVPEPLNWIQTGSNGIPLWAEAGAGGQEGKVPQHIRQWLPPGVSLFETPFFNHRPFAVANAAQTATECHKQNPSADKAEGFCALVAGACRLRGGDLCLFFVQASVFART